MPARLTLQHLPCSSRPPKSRAACPVKTYPVIPKAGTNYRATLTGQMLPPDLPCSGLQGNPPHSATPLTAPRSSPWPAALTPGKKTSPPRYSLSQPADFAGFRSCRPVAAAGPLPGLRRGSQCPAAPLAAAGYPDA